MSNNEKIVGMILQRVLYSLQLKSLPGVVVDARRRTTTSEWMLSNLHSQSSPQDLPFFSGCFNLFRAHRHCIACIHEFSFINKYDFMGQERRYDDDDDIMKRTNCILSEHPGITNNVEFNNNNRRLSFWRIGIKRNSIFQIVAHILRGLN